MNTVEPYSSFYESCVWIAVLLPLISFVVSSIIREQYAWLVSMLAPVCLLFSLIAALYVGIHTWNQDPYIVQWSWFHIGSHQIAIELLLNNLSVLMLMIVSGVSFLIHLYSLGYMAGDAGTKRYFAMLGLFTFSMLGIVVSGNIFMIFIFWELVGFSSYMLI